MNKSHLKHLFDTYLSERSAVGSDGTSLPRFSNQLDAEISVVLRKISLGTYKFTNFREKLLLKGAHKPPRIISIPTIRDKLVLKFLSELLADIFPEQKANPPHGIVKQVHDLSASLPPDYVFLRLDIVDFYPSIDHRILIRILKRKIRKPEFIKLLELAIKTPTGHSQSLSTVGVPQGLSISNILSSAYLTDIDTHFSNSPDLHYFRYVDDILIVCDTQLAEQLSTDIPRMLRSKLKLKCHKIDDGGKSKISKLSDGIDYLGYNFAGSEISIRKSSYAKAFSNLTKYFTSMKYQRRNQAAIWRLNIRISGCIYKGKRIGWMFYFSQTKDKNQLQRLDFFVRKNCRAYLNATDQSTVKTFIKAYHEIRFNYQKSTYFPNFDEFDDAQKRAALKSLLSKSKARSIDAMSAEEVTLEFDRLISREVRELERDMLDSFS